MEIKFKDCLCDTEHIKEFEDTFDFESDIHTTLAHYREIWLDGKKVGYIGTQEYDHKRSQSRMLCITEYVLFKEYRGLGLGKKILEKFINKYKNSYYMIYSWVHKDNADAIAFYSKVGLFPAQDPLEPYLTKYDYEASLKWEEHSLSAVKFWEDGERLKP